MLTMSLAYDMAYAVAAALGSPIWGYRLLRTGKWRTDWPSRFGWCKIEPSQDDQWPTLLIHAVSVGEVNAIYGLISALVDRTQGKVRLVISTTTDTGIARARELFEPQHRVVRYPLDLSLYVRRFLDAVKPDAVALVELEVWPNFVEACHAQHIPVCVINGRLSARSFKRYQLVSKLLAPTFSKLSAAAVQTQQYAQRFQALGVPADKVRVLDSMKWDAAQVNQSDTDRVDGADELAQAMGIDRARPVVVAGSTGPGEERLLIDSCPDEAQLVLVPRKPERFDEVALLEPGIIRRSRCMQGSSKSTKRAKSTEPPRVFLIDTMGELHKAYALADVAVIGRSFLGLYGSNPLEAVELGKPTIIGSHHSDFSDIVQALQAGKGIVVSDQPGQAIQQLLAHPVQAHELAQQGRQVILARQGATRRHTELLLQLLPQHQPTRT